MNENTRKFCEELRQFPLYAKIEPEALIAMVKAAEELEVDLNSILNGGLTYVNGKVVMSIHMLHALIREKKHSITRDKKSNETICILHGRRADNGDTWMESYSLEDAEREGLTSRSSWKIECKDKLFEKALLRLAQGLFSDVMKTCQIEVQ